MDVTGSRDLSLKLKDGVRLFSRVWTPAKNGPWPALLMRQPYGRQIASTVTYNHPSWWAKHGFLVVIQELVYVLVLHALAFWIFPRLHAQIPEPPRLLNGLVAMDPL